MWNVVLQMQFRDVVDVAVIAALLYMIFVGLRRARVVLSGLGTLTFVYFVARLAQLQLTIWVFQAVFAVLAIVLIVIFQSELRQLFERLAAWEFVDDRPVPEGEANEPLISAVSKLASSKVGALIVIPRRDPIDPHIAGGIPLGGRVSAPLIESLFDPNSPGHDGAVILDGPSVSHFAVHLPLSTNFTRLGGRGTRHAAALGLAERSDAICIVVSEERGQISLAFEGHLEELEGPVDLTMRLSSLLREKAEAPTARTRFQTLTLRRNWAWKVSAVAIALVSWVVFVSDFSLESRAVTAPVLVENLPNALGLFSLEPELISLRLQGSRRSLAQLETGQTFVVLDTRSAVAGEQTLRITPADVRAPTGLEILDIDPEEVRVSLVTK
jgi:diadenylate cyclase